MEEQPLTSVSVDGWTHKRLHTRPRQIEPTGIYLNRFILFIGRAIHKLPQNWSSVAISWPVRSWPGFVFGVSINTFITPSQLGEELWLPPMLVIAFYFQFVDTHRVPPLWSV